MLAQIRKKLESWIEKIENITSSFPLWLAALLSIILFRIILESFSSNFYKIYSLESFLHMTAFFICLLLSLILFLYFFTKEKITKLSNVGLIGWIIIIIPPVADLIISHGKGFFMSYLFYGASELWMKFITFFGKPIESGVTYGMRIQIALACILIPSYIFLKTKKYWKGILSLPLIYILIFFYSALPSIITIFLKGIKTTRADIIDYLFMPKNIFSLHYSDINKLFDTEMSLILIPLISLQLALWYYIYNKEKFWSIFFTLRGLRLSLQFTALGAGLYLGWKITHQNFDFSFFGLLMILSLFIIVFLCWLFSIVSNDIYDVEIDKMTNNSTRALATGVLKPAEFKMIALVSFLLTNLASLVIGYPLFILTLGSCALSMVYSVPPLRLKRVAFSSTFIMACGIVLITMQGFMLFSENYSLINFPGSITALLLTTFTLVLNVKDIKDWKGDKANNILTIPVVFGKRLGKAIIGGLVFLSFILFPIFLDNLIFFIISLGFGIIGFLLVYDRHSREKYVFILYSIYILLIILLSF